MSLDDRTSGRRFGAKRYETQPYNAFEAAAAGETTYDDGSGDSEYNQAGRDMLNQQPQTQPAPQRQGRPGRDSIFSQESLNRQGNTSGTAPFSKVFAETPLGDPNEQARTRTGIDKASYDLETAGKELKDVDFRLADITAQKTALRAQHNARRGTVAVNDLELSQESPVYTGLKQEEKELKLSKQDLKDIIREKESQITIGALRYGAGGRKSKLVEEFQYDVKSIKDVNPMDKVAKVAQSAGLIQAKTKTKQTTGTLTDPTFSNKNVVVNEQSIDRGNTFAKDVLGFFGDSFTQSFVPKAFAAEGSAPQPDTKTETIGVDYLKHMKTFASDVSGGALRAAQDFLDIGAVPTMLLGPELDQKAKKKDQRVVSSRGVNTTPEIASKMMDADPMMMFDKGFEYDTGDRYKTDYTKGFPTIPGVKGTPHTRGPSGNLKHQSMTTAYTSALFDIGQAAATGKGHVSAGLKLRMVNKEAAKRGPVATGSDITFGLAGMILGGKGLHQGLNKLLKGGLGNMKKTQDTAKKGLDTSRNFTYDTPIYETRGKLKGKRSGTLRNQGFSLKSVGGENLGDFYKKGTQKIVSDTIRTKGKLGRFPGIAKRSGFNKRLSTMGAVTAGAGAIGISTNPQDAYAFPVGAGIKAGVHIVSKTGMVGAKGRAGPATQKQLRFIADLQQQGKIDPSIPLPKTKGFASDILSDAGYRLPKGARRGQGRKKKVVQARRSQVALHYLDMYKDSQTATGVSKRGLP